MRYKVAIAVGVVALVVCGVSALISAMHHRTQPPQAQVRTVQVQVFTEPLVGHDGRTKQAALLGYNLHNKGSRLAFIYFYNDRGQNCLVAIAPGRDNNYICPGGSSFWSQTGISYSISTDGVTGELKTGPAPN